MSKAKRFISIILAVTMVFSIVSFEFASVAAGNTAASEKGGAFIVAPPVVTISATKVARVAASVNSLLAGNTLVKATPSGIPDLGSAAYANAAYAGETTVWPSVAFVLPEGVTVDASPALTITATTKDGSVSLSSITKSGQTYAATVTGGTAYAGNNIVYNVSYYYEGANYNTYAYTYVESILVPSGIQYFYNPYNFGVTGRAGKMAINYRYLGVNVYGSEVTGSATHGFYNYAAGSFSDNPASPHNAQLSISNSKGTKSQFNGGYGADDNRPQARVYIDSSTTTSLAQLNLRASFFLYDGLSNYSTDNRLVGTFVQAGNVASVSGEDSTSDPANNATALAQLGIASNSSVLVNKGDTFTTAFSGPGPVTSGTSYTITMKTRAPEGPDGARDLTGYTSVCLTAYKYDKGALRQKVNDILSGAAGGRSNPQSWYSYSPGVWDYFKAQFDYANLILNKPNTDQATIDMALLFLNDSYSSLIENDFAYSINYYIQGTTIPLAPSVTGSGKYSGYALSADAETFSGYTLVGTSPAVITLSSINRTINFFYTANPYTLSFQSNGGSTTNAIVAGYNTDVTKPSNPFKENHTFAGWFFDEACTQAVNWPLLMPLNGTTLYAAWNAIPATLTFNSNNGTIIEPVIAPPGTSVNKPADPTRENYGFDGWYYDTSFAQPVSWPIILPMSTVTIYAKWTINQYTVHYNSNGGTTIPSETVVSNTAVYLPSQPEKIGYTFSGWYYDNGTFLNAVTWPIVVLNSGYMLYAKWTPKSITITFNTAGGNAVAPLTALAGSAITAPAPPRKFGYYFGGWTLGGTPYVFSTMPVQALTLVAVWTVSEKAAKVTLKTYVTVEDELIPATSAYAGDVITVELSAKTNFYTGTSQYVIMYDSNFYTILGRNKVAIVPNTGNPYYVNAVSSYSGLTTSPAAEWPATITTAERAKYNFVRAQFSSSNTAANGGFPLILNDDIWLFRIRLQVKTDAEGSGHIYLDNRWDRSSTNSGGSQYYTFCPDATTPSGNGNSILDFDTDYLDANKSIQLDTTQTAFSDIIFNTNGGSTIATINGEVGTPTTLPAPPVKEGYTFTGWSPAFPSTFPANNVTLTAQWQINSYFANFVVDGNSYASVFTQYGALIIAPPNPTKPGCTFTGWSPAVGTMGAANKTFVALFTNNPYNAIFLVDGQPYDQIVTLYGAQIQAPDAPQKPGYTFTGWSPDVGIMPAQDKTFNAQFSLNTYYAYFVSDGVTIASVPTQFGNLISAPAQDPVKYGYIFMGWSPSVGNMGAANITFTAQWVGIYHNTNFVVDGNAYATVPSILGQPVVLPQTPIKEGYTFTGWANLPVAMPDYDITLNATWAINTYTVTFMVDSVVYETVPTVYGTTIQLPVQPQREGRTFDEWANLPLTMPAQNITINATFTANTYVARFIVDDVLYSEVPTSFAAEIVVPANPAKTGHSFLGWLDVPYSMPANDVEIHASFSINSYTATFFVDDEFYTSVSTPFDSEINLPAHPYKADGTFFGGWSPQVPTKMPAEALEFSATWVTEAYNAIFMVDSVEYTRVLTGIGAPIELPARPQKEGFLFLRWENLPSAMPSHDVTIDAVWIVTNSNIVAKPGSTTVIDRNTGFIYGLEAGITKETFAADFVQVSGYGEIRTTLYGTGFGTGTKVELFDGENQTVIKTYYIVIFGDVNGDGLIDTADRDLLANAASYQNGFTQGSAFESAADLTQDGNIDAFDLNILKAAVYGIDNIDQANPGQMT